MSSRGRSPSPRSIASSARAKNATDQADMDVDCRKDRPVSRGRDGKGVTSSRSPSRIRSRTRSKSNASMRSRSRSGSRSKSRSVSPVRSRNRSIPPPRIPNGSRDSHVPGRGPEWRVVIVSGLTKNVRREHLEEIFGKYGRITGLDLPIFPKSGQNRGKAAIEYVHSGAAEKARDYMDQGQLDGSSLTVVLSDLPLPAPERYQERERPREMDNRRGPDNAYRGGPSRTGGPRYFDDRNGDRNGPRYGRERDNAYGPRGGQRYFDRDQGPSGGPGGIGGRPGYGRDRDDPRNRYNRDDGRPGPDDRRRRPHSRSRSPVPHGVSGRNRRDSRSPVRRPRSRSIGRSRSRGRSLRSYSSYSRSPSRSRSLSRSSRSVYSKGSRSRSHSGSARGRSSSRSPVRKPKYKSRSPSPRK